MSQPLISQTRLAFDLPSHNPYARGNQDGDLAALRDIITPMWQELPEGLRSPPGPTSLETIESLYNGTVFNVVSQIVSAHVPKSNAWVSALFSETTINNRGNLRTVSIMPLNSLPTQIATFGNVPIQQYVREERQTKITGRGLGHEFEVNQLKSEFGPQIVALVLSNMIASIADGRALECISALLTTRSQFTSLFQESRRLFPHIVALYRENHQLFCIANRSESPGLILLSAIRNTRSNTGVAAPEVVLLPQGLREQIAFSTPNLNASIVGERQVNRLMDNPETYFPGFEGLTLFTIDNKMIFNISDRTDDHASLVDPLSEGFQYGRLAISDNRLLNNFNGAEDKYSTVAVRDVNLLDYDRGDVDWNTISILDQISRDLYFTRDGTLNFNELADIAKTFQNDFEIAGLKPHYYYEAPLVDPHLAHADPQTGAGEEPRITTHMIRMALPYFRLEASDNYASMNHKVATKVLGANVIDEINAGLEILKQAYNVNNTQSHYSDPSEIEAWFTSVVTHYRNRKTTNVREGYITAATRFGTSFLPPLVEFNGRHYIADSSSADNRDWTPMSHIVLRRNTDDAEFMYSGLTNRSLMLGADGSIDPNTATHGTSTVWRELQNKGQLRFTNFPVHSGFVPPGFSTIAHLFYLGSIPDYELFEHKWQNVNPDLFRTARKASDSLLKYINTLQRVYNHDATFMNRIKSNLFWSKEFLPFYQTFDAESDESLSRHIAFAQISFDHPKLPVAVGAVFPEAGITAGLMGTNFVSRLFSPTNPGVNASIPAARVSDLRTAAVGTAGNYTSDEYASLKNVLAWNGVREDTAANRTDRYLRGAGDVQSSFSANNDEPDTIIQGLGIDVGVWNQADMRVFINTLLNSREISDELRTSLLNDSGAQLRATLQDSWVNSSPAPALTPGVYASATPGRRQLYTAPNPQNAFALLIFSRELPIYDDVVAGPAQQRATAITALNRLFNYVSTNFSAPLTNDTLASVYRSSKQKTPVSLPPDTIDSIRSQSSSSARQIQREAEMATKSQPIFESTERPNADIVTGNKFVRYVITRECINPEYWNSVRDAKIHVGSILRPVNPVDVSNIPSNVIAPANVQRFQFTAFPEPVDGGARQALAAADVNALIAIAAPPNPNALINAARSNEHSDHIHRFARGRMDASLTSSTGGSTSRKRSRDGHQHHHSRQSGQARFGSASSYGMMEFGEPYQDRAVDDMVPLQAERNSAENFYLAEGIVQLMNSSYDCSVRLAHIVKVQSPFIRAQLLALWGAPLCTQMLVACVRENYVLPRHYVLATPFMKLTTAATVWSTRNVGQIYNGFVNNMSGVDPTSGKITLRLTYDFGAIVARPMEVTTQHHTMLRRYDGGGGAVIIDPTTIQNISSTLYSTNGDTGFNVQEPMSRRGDWFCFGIGCFELTDDAIFLDGKPDATLIEVNTATIQQGLNVPSHPSWIYVRRMTNIDQLNRHARVYSNLAEQRMHPRYSLLCWQTDQRAYNPLTLKYEYVAYDCGPLGPQCAGIGPILNGTVGKLPGDMIRNAPYIKTVPVGAC